MTALLLGSISTVCDTSELQRQAFNDAFAEHGLGWSWDAQTYKELLDSSGGRDRIADWAAKSGDEVDADAVHATKSEMFQRSLSNGELTLRPGVRETIDAVRAAGGKVAFVTTTSRSNIDALTAGLGDQVSADDFDVVLTSDDVDTPKPDGAVYRVALDRLGVAAGDAVAVEDNVGGVSAAVDAGVRCVAFPNENTSNHDFSRADSVVDRLDPDLFA